MQILRQQKEELRKALSLQRKSIPQQVRRELDKRLVAKILSLACFRYATTVLMFYPIGSEPDLLELARAALDAGKELAFPVCDKETSTMTFHCISFLDELRAGSYSIPEPPRTNAEYNSDTLDALCIVPALSFDRQGYRLGYGKGYYDRFLKTFKGTSVGALYSELLQNTVPRGFYDVPVDVLITEKGSIITNEFSEKSREKQSR